MAEPKVCIELWRGRLFIVPTYSPGPGTYVDKEPALEAPPFDPKAIGDTVLDTFRHFVNEGPWPVDWNTYKSPTLRIAGVSDHSEYQRGLTDDISISREPERYHIYTVRPHIYLPLTASPEEIGNAVLQAFGTTVEKERKKAERRQAKAQQNQAPP